MAAAAKQDNRRVWHITYSDTDEEEDAEAASPGATEEEDNDLSPEERDARADEELASVLGPVPQRNRSQLPAMKERYSGGRLSPSDLSDQDQHAWQDWTRFQRQCNAYLHRCGLEGLTPVTCKGRSFQKSLTRVDRHDKSRLVTPPDDADNTPDWAALTPSQLQAWLAWNFPREAIVRIGAASDGDAVIVTLRRGDVDWGCRAHWELVVGYTVTASSNEDRVAVGDEWAQVKCQGAAGAYRCLPVAPREFSASAPRVAKLKGTKRKGWRK
jgi:hypothetical protein